MGSIDERVEDGMEKKLAEIVDRVGDKGGDTEVICSRLALTEVEIREVNTGEIEERILVIGSEFVLRLGNISIAAKAT